MIGFSWNLKFQHNFVKKQQIHPQKNFIGKIGLKFEAHLVIYEVKILKFFFVKFWQILAQI